MISYFHIERSMKMETDAAAGIEFWFKGSLVASEDIYRFHVSSHNYFKTNSLLYPT